MAKKGKNKKQQPAVSSTQPARPQTGASGIWQNTRFHLLTIGLLALLLYANTLGHRYAQDDAIVITENMYTTKGVKGIPGIWSKDTFYGFFKEEGKAALVHGGRYRPLSLILFTLEWQLFGDNPFVFHLVNVLLYILTCMLVYRALRTITAYWAESQSKFASWLGALLFTAHPVHTEVVANIKGADEILALAGSLAALTIALKAYRKSHYGKLWLAAALLGVTIFAKENTITFVAIIPAAFWLFGQRYRSNFNVKKWLQYSVPLILGVLPFLLKRAQVLAGTDNGPVMELMNNPFLKIVNGRYVPFSPTEKLATIFYTLADYIRLLVFPHPLTSDYYPHHISMKTFGDGIVWLGILLNLGLILWGIRNLRQKPLISLGIFSYFASLSIVSNLFFPVGTFMAERFLFMPSFGFALVMAGLADRFFGTQKQKIALALTAIIVLAFGIKTVTRNPAWKNDETLFLTDVKISRRSAKIRNAAAGVLLAQAAHLSDATARRAKAQQALRHLDVALKEHPNYSNAWLLRGNALLHLEQYEQAIDAYKQALRTKPGWRDALNNLHLAYRQAGLYYGQKKNEPNKALAYLKEAEKLKPEDPETLRLLGVAYAAGGRPDLGIPYMERALKKMPDNADLALNISLAYSLSNNAEKAAYYKNLALRLDPKVINRRQTNKGQ